MAKTFTNKEVASLLRKVAAACEIKGENRFRIIAYDRVADAVEHATSEIKDLWDDAKLGTIPGIGANIAQHLDELFQRGEVKHFQEAMKGLPPAMFPLIEIAGLGPKTAYKLVQELGLKRKQAVVQDLIKAARNQRIRKIEGFGGKSEAKILASLLEYQKKQKQPPRLLLVFALIAAEEVITYLEKLPVVIRADTLGSLRRMVATVGDIDIAVASHDSQAVINHFVRYPRTKKVIEAGKVTASILLDGGFQVDLMVQPPESYGALLQHFTGSKHHNIHLREIGLAKGMSLSEYGIKIKRKGRLRLSQYPDEESFYQALGMDWIPPELREDAGEIEAAIDHHLPELVEKGDLRGDLHVHSSFNLKPSHDLGKNSAEELVNQAAKMGYDYLGFAEHNPSRHKHSQEEIVSLIKERNREIDKLNYSRKNSVKSGTIKLLKLLEVDILPDGQLAVPNQGLALLDGAIAAVHTVFKMTKEAMTSRILAALENPWVRILAHPTGRMLNKREGYELDWGKVFRFCRQRNKALEISAWPTRLDLPDVLVREAVKKGVKLVINSDAHATEEMEVIRFGVAVAKRGWTEKSDILNTLSYNQVINWFRQRS